MPSKYFLHNTASIRKYILPRDLGLCAPHGNSARAAMHLCCPPACSHLLTHLDIELSLCLPKFKQGDVDLPSYREPSVPCSYSIMAIFKTKFRYTSWFCSPQNTDVRSIGERCFVKSAPFHFPSSKNEISWRDLTWAQETFIQFMFYCYIKYTQPSALDKCKFLSWHRSKQVSRAMSRASL